MSDEFESYRQVHDAIKRAAGRAGRSAEKICLIAVTKKQDPEKIRSYTAYCYSQNLVPCFGENYVQECERKRGIFSEDAQIHFIGRLQQNKAKRCAALVDMIESVDSVKLARRLDAIGIEEGKVIECLLQVNISSDDQKGGFQPEAVCSFLEDEYPGLPHLSIRGLMTITRYYECAENVRPDFRKMAGLRESVERRSLLTAHGAPPRCLLSMGMSQDFEIAIEEGADIVRVGTALFGQRT